MVPEKLWRPDGKLGRRFSTAHLLLPGGLWVAGGQSFRGEVEPLPRTSYNGNEGCSGWACGPLAVYSLLRGWGYEIDLGAVAAAERSFGANETFGSSNYVLLKTLETFGCEVNKVHINSAKELLPWYGQGYKGIFNVWEITEGSLQGDDRRGDGHLKVAWAINDKDGSVLFLDPTFRPQDNGEGPAYGLTTVSDEGNRRLHFDFYCGCQEACGHNYEDHWNDARTSVSPEAFWEAGTVILAKPRLKLV